MASTQQLREFHLRLTIDLEITKNFFFHLSVLTPFIGLLKNVFRFEQGINRAFITFYRAGIGCPRSRFFKVKEPPILVKNKFSVCFKGRRSHQRKFLCWYAMSEKSESKVRSDLGHPRPELIWDFLVSYRLQFQDKFLIFFPKMTPLKMTGF